MDEGQRKHYQATLSLMPRLLALASGDFECRALEKTEFQHFPGIQRNFDVTWYDQYRALTTVAADDAS